MLSAAEVVVEQILEPHSGYEQEVPAVFATLFDIFQRALAFYASVLLICILAGAEGLIKLLQQILHLEVGGRLEGIVVARQRQRHSQNGQEPSPAGVIDSGDILRKLFPFEECRNGNRLFG